MKFKTKDNNKEEKVIKLYLEERPDGVVVMGEDYKGEEWQIIYFRDGGFERSICFPDDIGIDVTDYGRIKEIE